MAIAIVGCMDRRLNGYFEEQREKILASNPGETVYIIRDAGGGLAAVENTLLKLNITELHDYTHTDCGAMKVAMKACQKISSGEKLDEVESSEDVRKTAIDPYLGEIYKTLSDIEKRNKKIQTDELNRFRAHVPGLKGTCELIDVEKLNVPKVEGRHTLVIGMAFSGKYSEVANHYNLELSNIYFIQANNLEEIRPSVKLAVEKLNIRDVFFISNKDSENEIVEKWSNDQVLKSLFDKNLIHPPVRQTQKRQKNTQ